MVNKNIFFKKFLSFDKSIPIKQSGNTKDQKNSVSDVEKKLIKLIHEKIIKTIWYLFILKFFFKKKRNKQKNKKYSILVVKFSEKASPKSK